MPTKEIVLRCFAKKENNYWVAVCVDLSLAAQADTLEIAHQKLDEQVRSYIDEALTIHRAHADSLLTRKAPPALMLEYYKIKVVSTMMKFKQYFTHKNITINIDKTIFSERLPIKLA